jgi:hypothetical protein
MVLGINCFKWAMRAHDHMHGGTGLSFAPTINDITQAGFETDILKTIEKEGTGLAALSNLLFAVAKKPVNLCIMFFHLSLARSLASMF